MGLRYTGDGDNGDHINMGAGSRTPSEQKTAVIPGDVDKIALAQDPNATVFGQDTFLGDGVLADELVRLYAEGHGDMDDEDEMTEEDMREWSMHKVLVTLGLTKSQLRKRIKARDIILIPGTGPWRFYEGDVNFLKVILLAEQNPDIMRVVRRRI